MESGEEGAAVVQARDEKHMGCHPREKGTDPSNVVKGESMREGHCCTVW